MTYEHLLHVEADGEVILGVASAERQFLAAAAAVWRDIDRIEAGHGQYVPTEMGEGLRVAERAAWHAYRDALAREGRPGP